MIEAVEYVVRKSSTGERWAVWMIELDASATPARMIGSTVCSVHNTMAAADKKAAQLRAKDEIHIDKVMASA